MVRQLRPRYEAAALVAQHYADARFDVVHMDFVPGDNVTRWLDSIKGAERHLVVLDPSAEPIADRETAGAGKLLSGLTAARYDTARRGRVVAGVARGDPAPGSLVGQQRTDSGADGRTDHAGWHARGHATGTAMGRRG